MLISVDKTGTPMSATKILRFSAVLLACSSGSDRKRIPLVFMSRTSKSSSRLYEMFAF